MNHDWKPTKLGVLLKGVSRPVRLDPANAYRILGAHWYAKGLYVKEEKKGSEIRAETLFEVKEGDFVYNRLFAWKGSFAVATKDVDGCLVSNEFPCFAIRTDMACPQFLWLYFSRESAWYEALGLSTGSTPTSRNRLKEPQFLNLDILLPSLDEQRRIASRVDELSTKIGVAQQLKEELISELDLLCRSLVLGAPGKNRISAPMRELVKLRDTEVTVDPTKMYDFAGVYCFGGGVFRSQRKAGSEFGYKRLTRLRKGDFVYPKLMAWEGALGIVPDSCDGHVVSPEFPVFEVNRERILPEILDIYFRMPSVWPALAAISTGTNVRRRRLHPSAFLSFEMPVPPMEKQERIQDIKARADSIREFEKISSSELNSLRLSVLSKAFRGEL